MKVKTSDQIAREHYETPFPNKEQGIKMLTLEIEALLLQRQKETSDDVFARVGKIIGNSPTHELAIMPEDIQDDNEPFQS